VFEAIYFKLLAQCVIKLCRLGLVIRTMMWSTTALPLKGKWSEWLQ